MPRCDVTMPGYAGTVTSLHDAVAAATLDGDAIGSGLTPDDALGLRADGTKPSYRFRVRLGREHTAVARCSWCTMPIVEAEVDPLTGKPFMQDGRPYHQECRDYRR
jgi:hypothetical protein